MQTPFSAKKAITERTSIRNYQAKPLSTIDKEYINNLFTELQTPFAPAVRFHLIDSNAKDIKSPGTYGVIRNAPAYLACIANNGPFAYEAAGYQFEQLILHLTNLGLGTCWLGGTFNKAKIASQLNLQPTESLAALSPVGYNSDQQHLIEKMFKKSCKSHQRLPWENLFFLSDFTTVLNKEETLYGQALELVRLAPSAVNKQPWRIVENEHGVHFFNSNPSGSMPHLQQLDLGIALCHFHLACIEEGIEGEFVDTPDLVPTHGIWKYVQTWKTDIRRL